MKKIITGLFAIAAFTFSAVAQDQKTDGQRKEKHGMHKGHDGKGMEALNLTEAQKQQMKSINEDFKNRMELLNKNDNILVKDQKAQRKTLMEERKNKVSSILTAEQKTQFEQMHKNRDGKFGGRDHGQFGKGRGDMSGRMKTELGLTDDQVAKIKAGSESFKQRGKAIRENQSLSADQKKEQFETLKKDREASFKSYLTADQISKLNAMKKNHGDFKNKGDWKEKRKSEDGKEKIKVKSI